MPARSNNLHSGPEPAEHGRVRVALIHNPTSGETDHEGDRLVELLTRNGHEVEYHSSKGDWHSVLRGRPDLVAVAGGDGTVGEVARAAARGRIPITILPTGTANNIAGFLGLRGIPLDQLVARWDRAVLRPLDVGVARGPWGTYRFLESVGLGVLAELMSDIEKGESRYVNKLDGREPRIAAALEVLRRIVRTAEPHQCELRLDDCDLSGEYLLVEVLNFGAAGPNLRLAPHAHGDDGVLDVVLVEAHERAWLEQHVDSSCAGDAAGPPLQVHHARRITIRCSHSMLHLDDELWEDTDTTSELLLDLSLEPAALTFLVPAETIPSSSRSSSAETRGA
jgi:diacylglycerol kinase family enzyme